MDSQGSNAERTARYLHEEKLRKEQDGDANKKMSCRWFLDRSFYCVTPGNQMEHFYRYGQVDECKFTWKNMYLCYRASMMDEEKRQDFLKDTPLDASKGPHITDVWEEKETPSW
ncbi:hypothetical protein PHYSODRAFT_284032 [Phytophthora sojae]|uniref:Uncharacterized protein n=1 Tax=Phytophthora sojae (strain P6497) TaxID=1094619 RepID=G4YFG8_PHYSP|nr:hypothetical protein PHYSODRAFT_284032 [Phytophthora sojae]EGZ26953.1 hypothetical protein PHYSODRAFT_284032 [Phytophthora sojae]|eukprot:XP_009514228.1 hypothetical protein PHYSODRAFT_284032 [Phytophthora sojae]